ncbi:MAG TPA: glycosyltransferase [Bacillota bacterium]|nr:glycosyltransferase [Bacillota bacterium]
MSRYAYVTFIIRNDSYLPGALVFAYALRKQNTKHDLICVVSDNITSQAVNFLKVLYDDVIVMKEVYVEHERRHERQDRPFLFSRFNAFRLGVDGDFGHAYQKIIIADCDLLPLKGYDGLFNLDAPAGIINEKKEYCMTYEDGKYIIPDSVYKSGEWIWHQIYRDIPHGSKIPKEITDRINEDPQNMGINASLMLFEPSMTLYHSIMDDLLISDIQKQISSYNWPEMQYITLKMSGKWTNIDLRYSSFNGYPTVDVLYGIHFAGLKPWSIKNKSIKSYRKFPDYQLWFSTYIEMLDHFPELKKGKLLRIYDFLTPLISK